MPTNALLLFDVCGNGTPVWSAPLGTGFAQPMAPAALVPWQQPEQPGLAGPLGYVVGPSTYVSGLYTFDSGDRVSAIAVDASTGDTLWSQQLPGGGHVTALAVNAGTSQPDFQQASESTLWIPSCHKY
jgi:outer membrane protein assembly factor BamB